MKKLFPTLLLGLLLGTFARAQVAVTFDASPEEWTATGGWTWNSGDGLWETPGGPPNAAALLTSPDFTVDTAGGVSVTVSHRFNFETSSANTAIGFDGGQFQYSADGGTVWNTVPESLITGAAYNKTISPAFGNPIAGQRGFSAQSDGWGVQDYVTSTMTLGTGDLPYSAGTATVFNAGDLIRFRFIAGWDSGGTVASPNWAVDSVSITGVSPVPEPSAALLGLGAAGMMLTRRRRAVRA